MSATRFTGTLLEKIRRSDDTMSYRFTRPEEYRFQPGQWFTITLTTAAGPVDHHFSHADSPTEPFIELTTRLTGSEFKSLLDRLPTGAQAEIEGPYGRFLFGYGLPKIAFLTGGIGVTPVRSMLRYISDTGGAHRLEGQEIVVFYGSMTEDGVVYKDEFEEFQEKIDGLRVVHVITTPTESWTGYAGFITADIIRAELENPRAWTYYVVGPPPMVAAMNRLMSDLEIPQEQMVVESFTGYSI